MSYPLKSTCLYVAATLIIDVEAALHHPPAAGGPALAWSGGGMLVCLPWGPMAVIMSAALGLAAGIAVALAWRRYLLGRPAQGAGLVVRDSRRLELAMLATWFGAAAVAYFLGSALLFHGLSGVIAGVSVFAPRALLYPDLAEAYRTAAAMTVSGPAGRRQEGSRATARPVRADS